MVPISNLFCQLHGWPSGSVTEPLNEGSWILYPPNHLQTIIRWNGSKKQRSRSRKKSSNILTFSSKVFLTAAAPLLTGAPSSTTPWYSILSCCEGGLEPTTLRSRDERLNHSAIQATDRRVLKLIPFLHRV